MTPEELAERLGSSFDDVLLARGEVTVITAREKIVEVLESLKADADLLFDFLSDVSGTDWPGRDPRFWVAYHLYSMEEKHRLRAIEHVEVFRLGTRNLVTLPQRITDNLAGIIRKYHPTFVHTHFNLALPRCTPLHFVHTGIPMRNERATNYYAVLELSPGATEAEIKQAWHEHIQVWHPDRFVHSPTLHRKAESRTQLINQAYQILSDSSTCEWSQGDICRNRVVIKTAAANPKPSIAQNQPRRLECRS